MARILYEIPGSSPAAASSAASHAAPTLDTIIKASKAVPVAPEVLPKLQTKLLDEDSDVADLAALIKLDAGLAASVLRVSNSAYYSRSMPNSSIEEAVSLIGYQETLRLVARCSYGTVMKGALPCYGISGEQLWEEAVLAAFAMEELCRLVAVEVSDGYVVGLLHAVGMVAINDYFQRSGATGSHAPQGADADVIRWELDTIGFHRGDVGGAMMKQWRFPTRMIHAVERQFDPQMRAEDGPLTALLPFGSIVAAHVRALDADENTPPPVFDPVRVDHAGIDRQQLIDVIDAVRTHWAQTKQFLH